MAHCPKCGKMNPDDFSSCVYCGSSLAETETTQALPVPAAPGYYRPAREPVDVPQPEEPVAKIGFGPAIANFFKNYANFKGRATRSEFWFVYLFLIIVEYGLLAMLVGPIYLVALLGSEEAMLVLMIVVYAIVLILYLAILVPLWALYWRRLHDLGLSGANYFVALVPLIGSILLIVWMCLPSDGDNKYGPRKTASALAAEKEDPKE